MTGRKARRLTTLFAALLAAGVLCTAAAQAHVLVDAVPGNVIDFDPDRTLYLEAGVPKIKHRPVGTIEAVSGFPPNSTINAGFLAPHGAIFDVRDPAEIFNKVYEWRDGSMVAPDDLTGNLRVSGDYASWSNGALMRRDLATGTTVVVTEEAGATDGDQHDVAANGDVVYTTLVGIGDVFRFRDGASAQLTSNPDFDYTHPRTDGSNVVYRRTPNSGPPWYESIGAYYDGTGEVVLDPGRFNEMVRAGYDYQIADGFVAYTRLVSGQRQIFRHSPLGEDQQVDNGFSVAGVNELGHVMFYASRLRLSTSPGTTFELGGVGSMQNRGFGNMLHWDGSDWSLSLNGEVYRVEVGGADLSVTQTDAPDPAELGETVTYTAVVRNDGPATANRVVLAPRFFESPLEFQSATAPDGCTRSVAFPDRQIFSCSMGTIAAGQTATATMRFTARKNGTFSYTTPITSSLEIDPNTTDNEFVSATTIRSYVRPKGATPTLVSLVPASQACSAPNRLHEGPLGYDSCSPSAAMSPNVTVGTGDAGGGFPNMRGFIRLDVCPVAGCAAPNVAITSSVSDLRCAGTGSLCGPVNTAGGADYTGELASVLRMRITDSWSGPTADIPATVVDVDYPIVTPCTPTASDATKGSDCSITTTANAVVPNTFASGKRSIVELDHARVTDGGPDGDADTRADNALFATQGVFLP